MAVIEYLDSMHVTEGSKTSQFFEYILGENGKNISMVDGFFTLMSAAGLHLLSWHPKLAIPLLFTGTSSMVYRRGPKAAFIAPLAVVSVATNPSLAVAVVKEATETLGEAAKGAIQLGFQVTGLLVTMGGAVVGLVWAKKNKTKNT